MYKYDINLSVCNQINVLAIYFSYSYQFHENGNVNSIHVRRVLFGFELDSGFLVHDVHLQTNSMMMSSIQQG